MLISIARAVFSGAALASPRCAITWTGRGGRRGSKNEKKGGGVDEGSGPEAAPSAPLEHAESASPGQSRAVTTCRTLHMAQSPVPSGPEGVARKEGQLLEVVLSARKQVRGPAD